MSHKIDLPLIHRSNPFLARKHEILALVSVALDQLALAAEERGEDAEGNLPSLEQINITLSASMQHKGDKFTIISNPVLPAGQVFMNGRPFGGEPSLYMGDTVSAKVVPGLRRERGHASSPGRR